MARKLLRQTVTIATGVILAATMFSGLGLWRRHEDTKWCRQAAARDVVAGKEPVMPRVLDEVRSACVVQRRHQRTMFGVWRSGGRETARCGFELARLQLISDHDRDRSRAILGQYGLDGSEFEISNREHQDRFVNACLSNGQQEAR